MKEKYIKILIKRKKDKKVVINGHRKVPINTTLYIYDVQKLSVS